MKKDIKPGCGDIKKEIVDLLSLITTEPNQACRVELTICDELGMGIETFNLTLNHVLNLKLKTRKQFKHDMKELEE